MNDLSNHTGFALAAYRNAAPAREWEPNEDWVEAIRENLPACSLTNDGKGTSLRLEEPIPAEDMAPLVTLLMKMGVRNEFTSREIIMQPFKNSPTVPVILDYVLTHAPQLQITAEQPKEEFKFAKTG